LLRQIATAVDRTIVVPSEAGYIGIGFPQDGNYLYYERQKDKYASFKTVYRVSVLGGESTKVIENVDSPVTQSPDGKRLAFVRWESDGQEAALILANSDGSDQKKLISRKNSELLIESNPAWSPDGKVIVIGIEYPDVRGKEPCRRAAVQVDSGAFKEIPSQAWGDIGQIAWLGDGRGLLMAAADQSTAWFFQIWFVSYPDGKVRKVTNDSNNYEGISLSRDSNVMLAVQGDYRSNIWIAPEGDSNRAKPITAGRYDGTGGVAWAGDGKIVYGTRDYDIWVMDEDGTHQRLLTLDEHNNRHPAVSLDGRFVFFESWRNLDNSIWRVGIDGGGVKRITNGVYDQWPRCSPDGKSPFCKSYTAGKGEISKVSCDGGPSVAWPGKLSAHPDISPDGKRLAGFYWDVSTSRDMLQVFSLEGGEPEKTFVLPPVRYQYSTLRWTPDGKALTYSEEQRNIWKIWSQALAGGPPKQVTSFTTDRIWDFDWAPDDRLILARGPVNQDLVLISTRENRENR